MTGKVTLENEADGEAISIQFFFFFKEQVLNTEPQDQQGHIALSSVKTEEEREAEINTYIKRETERQGER